MALQYFDRQIYIIHLLFVTIHSQCGLKTVNQYAPVYC